MAEKQNREIKNYSEYLEYKGAPVVAPNGDTLNVKVEVIIEQRIQDVDGKEVVIARERRLLPNVSFKDIKVNLEREKQSLVEQHAAVVASYGKTLIEVDNQIADIDKLIQITRA